ncbi:RNA polymerase sigma factor [Subtercola boreus]|uniref:RNA polymerase sigma factor n=1 Tax=Subtercola boreus TaxID=120213 RepID=UPI000E2A05C9|nr:RNA polymerase sigma factor [Subtercola boreus]
MKRELFNRGGAKPVVSTDSDIILRSGTSPELFGQLYERHAATIHRYVACRAGAQVADDIMSETFLVAFDRRTKFDLAWASALPWLYGIATNLLKAHRRVEARTLHTLITAGLQHDASSRNEKTPPERSDDMIDAQLAVRALGPALATMRSGDRDTLLLHTWAGLDYAGIAIALQIPVGTVRSRLNRARKTLQAAAAIIDPARTRLTGTNSWTN